MSEQQNGDEFFSKAEDFRLASDYENAKDRYQLALNVYKQTENVNGRANVLRGLGEVFRLEDNYDEALSYYQQAMALYQSESHDLGRAFVSLGLGQLYRVRDQETDARNAYVSVS